MGFRCGVASSKPYHDEETLRELYSEQDKTIEEIADHFDVAISTIWRWFDKNDIEANAWDSPEERFHNQYEVDEDTGCWVWVGTCRPNGYGQISVDNKTVGAHRFSYQLEHGEIPEGAYICHTCHNKPCVNPDHLYAGDAKSNAEDAVEVGAYPDMDGSNHPNSKLTEETVVELRSDYADGATVAELSDDYGVSMGTVSRAINGVDWSHVGGPVDVDGKERMSKPGEDSPHSKLTEDDVREIRQMYDTQDVTMQDVADRFDISTTNVSDIVNRNIWAHIE